MATERKSSRRWLLILGGLLALLTAVGGWAYTSPFVQGQYAAYRLKSATDAESRTAWAERLVALGDSGVPHLLDAMRSPDPAICGAVSTAFDRTLAPLSDDDSRAVLMTGQILENFPTLSEPGRRAVLDLMPTLLRKAGPGQMARCREITVAALGMPDPAARLLAVRLAMHPRIDLRQQLLPLMAAPEAEVRRAVLFAIGPATGAEPVIGDEDLFRWLHDPDAGVRGTCQDALLSRGRTETEIHLCRRLTHPDVAERLRLVADLRFDDESVNDPEPWLERLSRDASPAVRAGAARVAGERHLMQAGWIEHLATADPDATVRQIAGYYHGRLTAPAVRQASGP